MRSQANVHRLDRAFNVGDWVWLKLQLYRQTLVKGRNPPKLARRYLGSYQVLRVIGKVAYELALPPEAHIHLVFHISKLKLFHGTPPSEIPPLSSSLTGTRIELQPHSILGKRTMLTPEGHRK